MKIKKSVMKIFCAKELRRKQKEKKEVEKVFT